MFFYYPPPLENQTRSDHRLSKYLFALAPFHCRPDRRLGEQSVANAALHTPCFLSSPISRSIAP